MRKAIMTLALLGLTSVALADVTVSGSVGYRNQDTKVGTGPQSPVDRYKAELLVSSKINDNAEAVVGVRTGSFNSAYTDYGNNANVDTVALNLAYVNYNVVDGVKVTLGKMNQPWASSSSYLFDRDVKPTGFAVTYNKSGVFANASQLTVVDGGAVDARLQELQVGYGKTLFGVALSGAVGRYNYANVGAQDYKVNQLFVSGTKSVAGLPVTVFAEALTNTSATDANDNAKAVGFKVGSAVNPKQWDVGYAYQTNEANSQYGIFNDSDFAGGQGNYKGNAYSANYVVAKGFKVGGKYFTSTRGAAGESFKRSQVDLTYSF